MTGGSLISLVDEIWTNRLSRNQNFRLFSTEQYQRALRLKRYLEALAEEILRREGQGELELYLEFGGSDEVILQLVVPRLQVRRTCYLTRAEFDLLCRHNQQVARLLERCDASAVVVEPEPARRVGALLV